MKTPFEEAPFSKVVDCWITDLLKKGFVTYRSSHGRCSVKRGVFRNFAKFTGKHIHQSLFFNTGLET